MWQVTLMRLMSKIENLNVPKGAKFRVLGKLMLIWSAGVGKHTFTLPPKPRFNSKMATEWIDNLHISHNASGMGANIRVLFDSQFGCSTIRPNTFRPITFRPMSFCPNTICPTIFSPHDFCPYTILSCMIYVQKYFVHNVLGHKYLVQNRFSPKTFCLNTFSPCPLLSTRF